MPSAVATPSDSKSLKSGKPRWPDWSGETVACIATGPSLTAEQIVRVKDSGIKAIAINEAGLDRFVPLAAPWADILYAADRRWWRYYIDEVPDGIMRVSGEVIKEKRLNDTVIPAIDTIALKMLDMDKGPMPKEPGSVVSGGHSGFQALGLALSLGAKRILLLGYDCGGPKRNCHEDRPEVFCVHNQPQQWVQHYNRVPKEWPDVEVINCSPISKIACFKKRPIEEVL